ncbi:phage tail assembly protein T [Serratia sp. NPDC078593]|uniref:phage tail assembly protein T n=1 Tax=unclassified Serratia (in: enterobacteria) TaxID=2647522 RepID=UPI0037CE324E
MKLALRLGKTLGELKQTISISELRLWAAYDRINPIGDVRGDVHAAQISAAIYNAQRGPKDQPVDLNDLVLKWSAEDEVNDGGDTSDLESWFDKMAG